MKTMNIINATCGENFTAEGWMQLQFDCCYNEGSLLSLRGFTVC